MVGATNKLLLVVMLQLTAGSEEGLRGFFQSADLTLRFW
jgi:hypothetical protein